MSLKRDRSSYERAQGPQSYVAYGTALPTADIRGETRDDGSYVPVWKQEVTDERGRKRLHGAFTGGFSAGYFNTVGSKEGWAPSTFKSSRSARGKVAEARPEDFMDNEDLRDAEEARQIETRNGFAGVGTNAKEPSALSPHAPLLDLLAPAAHDTMGAKLLKRMGWKEGQGIGPRVKRKANDVDDACLKDNSPVDGDSGLYFFAPPDSALVSLAKRPSPSGLGYMAEASLKKGDDLAVRTTTHQVLKPSRGVAFGVGVLNDDGEDEEDPYEIRPKTAYNKTIEKGKPTRKNYAVPQLRGKHAFVSKKTISKPVSSRKCHDGRLPIPGFILTSTPTISSPMPPAPDIPADWLWKAQSSTVPSVEIPSSGSDTDGTLDPRARGTILGEVPLPGKSVFDYLKPSARDRIASITGKGNLPPALGEAPPLGSSVRSSFAELVPRLDREAASSALAGGFMPYADDTEKRSRYRTFLEVQAGLREGLPDRKYGMNTQEWLKELNEFVGAARLFKPLTGMIATRFTSSASTPETEITLTSTQDTATHLRYPAKAAEDPAEIAAHMSMYGTMTRRIEVFVPHKLLSKRFNVRAPPAPQSSGTDITNDMSKGLVSHTYWDQMAQEVTLPRSTDSLAQTPAHSLVPAVNADRNEALEGERAGDHVFKTIFGTDEEDDGIGTG